MHMLLYCHDYEETSNHVYHIYGNLDLLQVLLIVTEYVCIVVFNCFNIDIL